MGGGGGGGGGGRGSVQFHSALASSTGKAYTVPEFESGAGHRLGQNPK
jgi:hypothetical protein